MNSCILMAEFVQDPQLRYTADNQTPLAEMLMQIPSLRSEDAPESLKAIAWGNLAQEVQEQYRGGDRVILEGRLGMVTVELEGFKEKRAELTIQRIHRFGNEDIATHRGTAVPAVAPAAPAPVAKAKKPGNRRTPVTARTAAASAIDADDIPF